MRRVNWLGLFALALAAGAAGLAALPAAARAAPAPKDEGREKDAKAFLLAEAYGGTADETEQQARKDACDKAAARLAREHKDFGWTPSAADFEILQQAAGRDNAPAPGVWYKPNEGWRPTPEFLRGLGVTGATWTLKYDAEAERWKTVAGQPPANDEMGEDERERVLHQKKYDDYHVFLRVALTPRLAGDVKKEVERLHDLVNESRAEAERVAREDVVKWRLTLLAKVLAGAVVLLLVVGGYLRLEEATRGYFTTLLRLGAAGVVLLTVVGLTFLRF
jgi:hypothetical protein